MTLICKLNWSQRWAHILLAISSAYIHLDLSLTVFISHLSLSLSLSLSFLSSPPSQRTFTLTLHSITPYTRSLTHSHHHTPNSLSLSLSLFAPQILRAQKIASPTNLFRFKNPAKKFEKSDRRHQLVVRDSDPTFGFIR